MESIIKLLSQFDKNENNVYLPTGKEAYDIKDQLNKFLAYSVNFEDLKNYIIVFIWIEDNKVCIEY